MNNVYNYSYIYRILIANYGLTKTAKPVSQHYRILLATHCRLWTYQQLYTRTFSVTLFGKLTTYLVNAFWTPNNNQISVWKSASMDIVNVLYQVRFCFMFRETFWTFVLIFKMRWANMHHQRTLLVRTEITFNAIPNISSKIHLLNYGLTF